MRPVVEEKVEVDTGASPVIRVVALAMLLKMKPPGNPKKHMFIDTTETSSATRMHRPMHPTFPLCRATLVDALTNLSPSPFD